MVDFLLPVGIVIALGFLISCCWFFRPSQADTVIAVSAMLRGDDPAAAAAAAQQSAEAAAEEQPKGLDRETIDSYPRVVVGKSGRMINPDDDTCPICLNKYGVDDIIKILPECLHRFHADCLDEWLDKNATCPVCRIQPPVLSVVVS